MSGQWKLQAQVQFYQETILTKFPDVSQLESYQSTFPKQVVRFWGIFCFQSKHFCRQKSAVTETGNLRINFIGAQAIPLKTE